MNPTYDTDVNERDAVASELSITMLPDLSRRTLRAIAKKLPNGHLIKADLDLLREGSSLSFVQRYLTARDRARNEYERHLAFLRKRLRIIIRECDTPPRWLRESSRSK
jgi:hypothetical protein